MISDENATPIQVLAVKKIVAVVANVAWQPAKGDVVFCVPVDCLVQLNSSGGWASLYAGNTRGIRRGFTYNFDTGMNIEVM